MIVENSAASNTSGGSYQTSTVNGTTRKSGGTDSAGDHYHTMADGTTGCANKMQRRTAASRGEMKN